MNKIVKTFSEINEVAKHHYGDNRYSLLKFLYYSTLNVNIFKVYAIMLDDHLLQPDSTIAEFEIITRGDVLINLRDEKRLPREFYYDQMHDVGKFYLLIKGREIAYIHWVYVKKNKNRFLWLGDLDAELNYNTTMPKFRGKGLMNHVMRYILIDLKKQGFKRAFGVVNKENVPAIKSMIKCGFSEIAEIRAVGQFNRKVKL